MEQRDVIAMCGTTCQPLTIGLRLCEESFALRRVVVVTTFTTVESIGALMDEYFPHVTCRILGSLVSGAGNASDITEFTRNIRSALAYTEKPIGLVASGTNWMTWHFSRLMVEHRSFSVRTHKAFQDKSFFPANERLMVDSLGALVPAPERVSELIPLELPADIPRLTIVGKVVHFLGHELTLSAQEAAMFAYFVELGGMIDLDDPIHDEAFSRFCEQRAEYDSYRVLIDEGSAFAERFRHNVSKINRKVEEAHDIVRLHIAIMRQANRFYLRGMVEAAGEWVQ